MAKRPVVSIGIQPQIAVWSVVLFGACVYGWYTERYKRDEDDIEDHIKRLYLDDTRQAQAKITQISETLKGSPAYNIDDRLNNMVWGGKAQLNNSDTMNDDTNYFFATESNDEGDRNGNDFFSEKANSFLHVGGNTDGEDDTEDEMRPKKNKRRKKKREQKTKNNISDKNVSVRCADETVSDYQQVNLLQPSFAGIAVGALAVAAAAALKNRSGK